jgi:hypothetical protein
MHFMKGLCGHAAVNSLVAYALHFLVSSYVILVWNMRSHHKESKSEPRLTLCSSLISFSLDSKCNEINRRYFFNQPIVSFGEAGVTINYSRLQLMNQPYISPVIVSTSPIHQQPDGKYYPSAVAAPAPIVTAVPVPPSPQVLQVTIPEGYTPGSTMTVSAPNGHQISVN